MTRAGVYVRISSDPTGRAAGVARQEEDSRALCERFGWDVAEVYRDNDLSASSGKLRPAWEDLLADLEAGTVRAVVAWHPDRLYRRMVDLERLVDVVERSRAKVATVTAGDIDLATASGRMVARILGATAQAEAERVGERVKRKVEELARDGKVGGGGTRPFGFAEDRITSVGHEAEIVREAASRVLEGEGIRRICADLNRRQVPTVTGAPWKAMTLRRILTAPRTAGLRELRGEVVADAVWPPLLDRETWEQVRVTLDRRHNRPSPPRRYLLTGLLVCGRCKVKMIARPKDDHRRQYVCSSQHGGCGKMACLAEALEAEVRDQILAALNSPALGDALRAAADEDVTVRDFVDDLRDTEERLAALSRDFYTEGDLNLGRGEFLEARAALEAKVEDTRRALEGHRRASTLASLPEGAEAVRQAWDERDLRWRRQLLEALVDRVELAPAVRGRNFFDPDRVAVVWKA